MKIVTIIGARPQFVKAAVVSRVFRNSGFVNEIIVHTGQHFDSNMSDVFFEEMSIPEVNENLAIHGLSHGAMTGQMLEKIESILLEQQPDWVLVYGDTNSTLAGALAAKKLHIKVAHVEAGLRSNNMDMPEEINRILTDRISNILFYPTEQALRNLSQEGLEANINYRLIYSGDVMYDAALFYKSKAKRPNINIPDDFILCTIHRAENTDNLNILSDIFRALESISKKTKVIIPLHPRTKQKLKLLAFDFESSNIIFIDPVGYFEMLYLIMHSRLIMTDSGGLQKEAYFFNKHCVVLRNETEWVELVEKNYNVLVGSNYELIISNVEKILSSESYLFGDNLYGNGNAGEIILQTLLDYNN